MKPVPPHHRNAGFTLVEMMVVVAILAVIAVPATVGFNGFRQTVRVEETAGVLRDRIRVLEYEALRRDYEGGTASFTSDYMVVQSKVRDSTLDLSYLGTVDECDPEEDGLGIDNTAGTTALRLGKGDGEGRVLASEYIETGESVTMCVSFRESGETEWQYQLFDGTGVSDLVRFMHFNLDRTATEDPVQIYEGTDFRVRIEAPYAATVILDKNNEVVEGLVTLTVGTADGGEKTITLQE